MDNPLVSVIIPAFNGADHLGDAIQSVLHQTYPYFELIIVDDASPDHTAEIIRQFDDPRIKYLVHKANRGANEARLTGINASQGDLSAFLDQDDIFHHSKLQTHIETFEKHPEVGLTYNAFYQLNYSTKTIRDITRPPNHIRLVDLVLGFPIVPSSAVLRRKWALRTDILDDAYIIHTDDEVIVNGGEHVMFGRLFLAGCQFASVGRSLHYRRHFSGRVFSSLRSRCDAERAAQETIFNDPRCPPEVLAFRNVAFTNTYLVWAFQALNQHETELGRDFLLHATRLKPTILEHRPCELVRRLVPPSIADENKDHELLLRDIFAQLPSELSWLNEQHDWAVGQGYLLKAARAVIWDRPADGNFYFAKAQDHKAQIDEAYLRNLASQLFSYEIEFGAAATQEVLRTLTPFLQRIGSRKNVRWLKGCHSANMAFRSYQAGQLNEVPVRVGRAIANDPKNLTNRGLWSILYRSIAGSLPEPR